ncbi:dienelactone hydrolase family protein [Nocardia abscessus]|uniref:dienelactone hydrolase family protein n=1 Tax=Nocardia abscessus TaxID=120957 RepID=UPI001895C9E8|nr:dienelactone hydrolase family protein [Nocardia abscessus]MBF6336880.1 dienelactone hydrolase family protein [Nocardia abscessus]
MTSPVTFEPIDLALSDGVADAYFAHPDDGARHPGVLFFMDAFGLRPWLAEMVRTIAGHGYTVLAPNLFYRSGRAPVLPMPQLSDPDARDAFFAALGPLRAALTPQKAIEDADAYLDWLAGSRFVTPGPLATTGYCLGGRLALRTAAAFGDRVAAAAGFHGGGLADDRPDSPHHEAAGITAELFVAHADQDPSMPPEQIARLEAALDTAGVRYTSVVYPGAQHGFTMRDTAVFHEDAYERHLRDLFALLDRSLRATAE